jgi:hypothetical protein
MGSGRGENGLENRLERVGLGGKRLSLESCWRRGQNSPVLVRIAVPECYF